MRKVFASPSQVLGSVIYYDEHIQPNGLADVHLKLAVAWADYEKVGIVFKGAEAPIR